MLKQCDGMHGFQWHGVSVYWWCDRRRKQLDELLSAQRYTVYSNSAKCHRLDWTPRRWTDARWTKKNSNQRIGCRKLTKHPKGEKTSSADAYRFHTFGGRCLKRVLNKELKVVWISTVMFEPLKKEALIFKLLVQSGCRKPRIKAKLVPFILVCIIHFNC